MISFINKQTYHFSLFTFKLFRNYLFGINFETRIISSVANPIRKTKNHYSVD